MVVDENPFTLTTERRELLSGSLVEFVKRDLLTIKRLFHYDFSSIERDCSFFFYSAIEEYKTIETTAELSAETISMIQDLSKQINDAIDENVVYDILVRFHFKNGVGFLGLNRAFRLSITDEFPEIIPISSFETSSFDDLIGYETQKKALIENTTAFVNGTVSNNCLLYGDVGTGKSSSIKALSSLFYEQGLRIIEIYKSNIRYLPDLISILRYRNYKFIIYMDDLSFEDFETEYKYLKAVIEGGLETKPQNVLIYATSNRRHLIKELWNDRDDMTYKDEVHRSDTVQEKLSLSSRFGISIGYFKPSQDEFLDIVLSLVKKLPINININEDDIKKEAIRWELKRGSRSGRLAKQFVDYLVGKQNEDI